MEQTPNTQELHWSWLLVVFLVILVLLIVFGDLLTFIVGAISLITIFAGYYSSQHKEI